MTSLLWYALQVRPRFEKVIVWTLLTNSPYGERL